MVIVPVIDLKDGSVVRGIGGRREEYRPIVSQIAADARPATVARALADHFEASVVYVADLDAIRGGPPNLAAYRQIAASGMKLWLDAGIGDLAAAQQLRGDLQAAQIAADLVVGLESLADSEALGEITAALGPSNLLFSLDLKAGQPLTRIPTWQALPPQTVAQHALEADIRRIILLDLADVGTGRGTSTLSLCRELLAAHPHLGLTLGGGVRSVADLRALSAAGANAALVASALHDGRLTRDDCLSLTAS